MTHSDSPAPSRVRRTRRAAFATLLAAACAVMASGRASAATVDDRLQALLPLRPESHSAAKPKPSATPGPWQTPPILVEPTPEPKPRPVVVPVPTARPTPAPVKTAAPARPKPTPAEPAPSAPPIQSEPAPPHPPAAGASNAESAEGEELDLEALFNTQVEVATKRAQSLAEAPAVVSVVTAEDIRERGYNSVAEALQALPGFYIVNDNFMPNLGVRGIPSGQRAWSRIVKVMIDGTPVPYLPEATNFLGPELIPIGLIKRIEIIRGPGSALYGADAYLGVINVVTKRGDDMAGGTASLQGGLRGTHGQVQGSVVAGYPAPWREGEAIAGAQAGLDDRSGYQVPDSSPFAGQHAGQVAENDVAHPASFYTRVGGVPLPYGSLAAAAGSQQVSSGGEFQDFHAFSHDSRITLENRFGHVEARNQFGDNLSTNVSVGYASGAPGQDDILDTGTPDHRIRREEGSSGLTAAAEGSYAFDSRNSLTAGADYSHTTHNLPTYFDVFTAASGREGQEAQDGEAGGIYQFDNMGLYSQGIVYLLEDTALTLGGRLDVNNVYGNTFNSRVGLVSPLAQNLSAKLLYGSSFKAPSPQQLYGRPLIFYDIQGKPDLKPEQAQTVEAALIYSPNRGLDLLTNAYYTHISNRVSFVVQGGNSRAVNEPDSDSVGLEGEAKWRWRWLHGNFNLSLQATAAAASADPATASDETAIPEAYPNYMANAGIGAPLGSWPLSAYLEGRLVGPVPTTQNNYVVNGLNAYTLPPTLLFDATLASKEWTAGPGQVSASLKLVNVFDSPDAQPGFGGVDYPGTGRTLIARIDYAW